MVKTQLAHERECFAHKRHLFTKIALVCRLAIVHVHPPLADQLWRLRIQFIVLIHTTYSIGHICILKVKQVRHNAKHYKQN